MIKLSIIIPAYNAEPYLGELVHCLEAQMVPEAEVIIVDDGSDQKVSYSFPWLKVYRQKNKGPASARNKGLDKAKGEYISFIDADDMVPGCYMEKILNKISEKPFDVCDLSWKSLNKQGMQVNKKLNSENDWLSNPSACTRVFNRDFIGDTRFTELKDSTEDEDFSRRLGYLRQDTDLIHTVITDYLYFYRTAVSNSNSKRYRKGLKKTKRVTYYYKHVTKDMTWLVEEIKKEDELNEVILLTNQNDIPELMRWCQVFKPHHIWTHYLRGETYHDIEVVPVPHKTQIVLYENTLPKVGGIGTFIYNFCQLMREHYDITYVVNQADNTRLERIRSLVTVIRNEPNRTICCDTLIMLRIVDRIPGNIIYNKSVQMCHACKYANLHIPQKKDFLVTVSETSKESWNEEANNAIVIHNPIKEIHKRPLLLMSATRIPAPDKGDNEKRMIKLANMLNNANIPFQWLNFSDGKLTDPPKGFHNMGTFYDIDDFFTKADYIVQLSSAEAWSYTILEALSQNIPVICTPFPSAYEMGMEDGKNGYILPFDMDFDVTKLLNIPKFEYDYSNDKIFKQWKALLDKKPEKHYQQLEKTVKIKVRAKYYDMDLKKELRPGEIYYFSEERAKLVSSKGYIRVLEE